LEGKSAKTLQVALIGFIEHSTIVSSKESKTASLSRKKANILLFQ